MKFKTQENQLMWESYQSAMSAPSPSPTDELSVVEVSPSTELDIVEEPTPEVDEVLYSDLKKLAEYSDRLLKACHEHDFEPWMKTKIVKASDYVSEIWHRLDAGADFANTGVEQSINIDL
jgi:hypothetical protein